MVIYPDLDIYQNEVIDELRELGAAEHQSAEGWFAFQRATTNDLKLGIRPQACAQTLMAGGIIEKASAT